MIKLLAREMKSISRILTAILCLVPFAYANAAGPVATTSGSNLTAYNPSTAYNNEWATMANGRTAPTPAPRADFGNCNAIVIRCAQPKCANGGCADAQIASAIVAGCVQSNENCKQYGDDLINYMTAQLVASSTAKINEQRAAADAAAAAAQNDRQTEQMAAMQQQMVQMQQQMAQQQAESAAQLQQALSQQAAQNASALENMKTAATNAAMADQSGLNAYEREAIAKGISLDVLERQKISGQILQKIDDAALSLKQVNEAMQTSFTYAGCDKRGNDCAGPKRVKKWRELALNFLEPYDTAVDKVYEALNDAIILGGIDLSDIYMMLSDSCNSWAQYMCPYMEGGKVVYDNTTDGKKVAPRVCPKTYTRTCIDKCNTMYPAASDGTTNQNQLSRINCVNGCYDRPDSSCKQCTMLKVLGSDEKDAILEGWINADNITKENTTVVACATGALVNNKFFRRKANAQSAAGTIDVDVLNTWLSQVEKNSNKDTSVGHKYDWCNAKDNEELLRSAALSKTLQTSKDGAYLCADLKSASFDKVDDPEVDGCPYVNPIYAICDTHMYNIGNETNTTDSSEIDNMKEIIGLKTTVVSQQMYKQYEYLSATIRRIKTQLEKAVTTANLEAAGAKSNGSSASIGGLAGGNSNSSQYANCMGKDEQNTIYCLRENYNALAAKINSKKCQSAEKKQLKKDLDLLKQLLPEKTNATYGMYGIDWNGTEPSTREECETALSIYNIGLINWGKYNTEIELNRNRYNRY